LKAYSRVASVAERFVLGVPTAAQRNQGSPRKPKRVTRSVLYGDVAADDAKRAIVCDYYRLIVFVAHQ
jgi:hypothetical protein